MTDKQIILSLTRELEAATKPKWVSVHDCVPAIGDRCILALTDGYIEIGCYEGETFGFTFDNRPVDATHWQPAPEAPKEGE